MGCDCGGVRARDLARAFVGFVHPSAWAGRCASVRIPLRWRMAVASPNNDSSFAFVPGDDFLGAAPVPDVGVIRLLSPPPTLFVTLRHARLADAWDARFAQLLEPQRAVLHGDAAGERLEQELICAIALREQAFDAQAAQTVQIARVMGGLLTASADLGGHRRVLSGLQRAIHAAPQPWHLLEAVRAELAPWCAQHQALERLLVDRLVENFAFLDGQIELRAGHDDDGALFVDVAYAPPDATLPPRQAPDPWLVRGFLDALRGQCARPRLVSEIWEIMDRSYAGEASHG